VKEFKVDFSNITGQQEIVCSLKRLLSEDRIGHAYIFSGSAGLGKKTIAHIFGGLLLCENSQTGSMCGQCTACRLFEHGSNPDYHRISTSEASIGVELIREIQEDVAVKPVYSKYKVYIIEDAEKMTVQAQNCLLKTLEEPPRYVVIILLTTNFDALLETVRSRAQHFHFKKYTREQVTKVLKDRLGQNHEIIELAADYSDGNIGVALELAASEDFAQLRNRVMELMPGVNKGKTRDIFAFSALMEEQKENAGLILNIMQLYYRDILVICETGNYNMLINSDKKDIIVNNAQKGCSRRFIGIIEAIEAARRALKQNANYQLVIENMLIKLREDV